MRVALEARAGAAPRGGLARPRHGRERPRVEGGRVSPGDPAVLAVDLQPPSPRLAGAYRRLVPLAHGHRQEHAAGVCACARGWAGAWLVVFSGGGGSLPRERGRGVLGFSRFCFWWEQHAWCLWPALTCLSWSLGVTALACARVDIRFVRGCFLPLVVSCRGCVRVPSGWSVFAW